MISLFQRCFSVVVNIKKPPIQHCGFQDLVHTVIILQRKKPVYWLIGKVYISVELTSIVACGMFVNNGKNNTHFSELAFCSVCMCVI